MKSPFAHLSLARPRSGNATASRIAVIIGGGNRLIPAAIAIGLALTALLYLGYTARLIGTLGFPLDDAWIHQVFARSLARGDGLAFNSGEPIAGTTAPLWTFLLVPGQWSGAFQLWTAGVGLAALGATAWFAARLAARSTGQRAAGAVAGFAVAFDWRLDWAALSGMETLLFALLALVALDEGLRPGGRPGPAGLAAGLATLTRPEGVLLLPLIAVLLLLRGPEPAPAGRRDPGVWPRVAPAAAFVAAALGPLLIGVVFNWSAGGQILPSTFYAKSDFYGGVGSLDGAARYLWGAALALFWGPLLLLLPGLFAAALRWRVAGPERWLLLGLAGWTLALPAIYLARLPVLYHHGRYLLPAIPALVILAVWGGVWLWRRLPLRRLARAYLLCAAGFYAVLWINGAQVFAWNVRYIQDEQVQVAAWLRENTAPEALVATHDVGAIGYFANRRVIDLAGLVTPDLTGHLHDEEYLARYLRDGRVQYLAILPDWYPQLAPRLAAQLVFSVDARYVIEAGGVNFRIYRLPL